MAADALAPGARELLHRQASVTPATWNPAERTVEVTWTAGAAVTRSSWDGDYLEVLATDTNAIRLGRLNAGAPVLDSHDASGLASVLGVVRRAWIENGEGRALMQFSDRAEVLPIAQDVKNGVIRNVSVGYKVHRWEITPPSTSGAMETRTAVDWEPYELSLVPIPADAGAQVRSENIQNNGGNMTNEVINDNNNLDIRADERRRAASILDAARKLNVDEGLAQKLIADGVALDEARLQLIDARAKVEQRIPAQARSFEPGDEGRQTPLQRQLDAAIVRGEQVDFHEVVRSSGARGRTHLERVQDLMLQRAMHSTSDLPLSLLSSMDARLQQVYPSYNGGILNAADVRPIADFREYGLVDSGLVGTAKKIKEGGEVNYTEIKEAALKTKPSRYGHALSWSVEAQANDGFLGALRQGVDELGFGASDAEKVELVYLLEGTANGGTCADGQALFHSSHNNAVAAGPIGIDKIGAAVALLRGQKSVGGRNIDQQPAMIICGTGAELTIRQLLSTAVVPNNQSAVNPWASFVDVEVEPRLGDTYCYLISAGPRKPLELGRLYPAPQISSMVDFETGAFKAKAEHAFGVAVSEFRAVVRLKLSA